MQLICIKELGWSKTVVLSPLVVLFHCSSSHKTLRLPQDQAINAQHNRQSPAPCPLPVFSFYSALCPTFLVIRYSDITPAAAAAKSHPILCDPIDGSPPGSPVPGILQARTLEWVAISFSNAWKWKESEVAQSSDSSRLHGMHAAYRAPLSMGFFRQEYWSGVPLPSPRWVYII